MIGKVGKLGNRAILLSFVGLMLLSHAGCTRRFFRKCADNEVAAILNDKDQFPEWKIENYHVYADPRARFADPTNPDRPPMPPDDPAAQWLGPNPQRPPCKAGIARIESDAYLGLLAQWDADNRTMRKQKSPNTSLPSRAESVYTTKKKLNEGGIQRTAFQEKDQDKDDPGKLPKEYGVKRKNQPGFLISLDQAVELGLINSREYQARREDLYLTALPVTSERFAFAPQAFAVQEAIREHTGNETSTGHGDRWRANSTLGVTKLFSTGALLLIGYANRTVIELTNPNALHTTSVGTLNLDIAQPLLAGGGRAVTLEPLTQAERNLLYEIRDYARFRKEYFQYISAGGVTVRAGTASFGGRGLSPGSISLGSGNPARPEILPSGAGRLDLGIASIAQAEGYLPTLQKEAELQNEFKNEDFLRNRLLRLYKVLEEGNLVSKLQVDQVVLNLLRSESNILRLEQALVNGLDNFKLQLGLPPNINIELDDEAVKPIRRQLEQYEAILDEYERIVEDVDKRSEPAMAKMLRDVLTGYLTKSPLVKGTKAFPKSLSERWEEYKKLDQDALGQQLKKERTEKRELLFEQVKLGAERINLEKREKALAEKGQSLSPKEQAQLKALDKQLAKLEARLSDLDRRQRVGNLEYFLRDYERKPKDESAFRDVFEAFSSVLSEALRERFELMRTSWPQLAGVNIEDLDLLDGDLEQAYEVVTRTALANRLDLMNEKARMNDAWRQIAIFANSLLGVFNVGYHMDSSTPPGEAKPLAFSPSRARHQLFLNGELPLVRLAERNSYRASLIAYQRARRNLMEFEDRIALQIRTDLRQVRTLAENYRIQQRAVELNYQQVDQAVGEFGAPPVPAGGPGVPGAQGQDAATRAAALTNQVLTAQQGLVQAQNALYQVWISYIINRQRLYLDLELMPLDTRGVWIDEHTTPQPAGQPAVPPEQVGNLPPVAQRDSARPLAEKTQTLR